MSQKIIIGDLIDCIGNPRIEGNEAIRFYPNSAFIVRNGIITHKGPKESLISQINKETEIIDYSGKIIVPGFIDTHVHYPQTEMMGAYGEQLITWLNNHAFPTEIQFQDFNYAYETATLFLSELIKNGTTTALVFGTVHPQSVDAFFSCAQKQGLRMICGKVLMDRNCPAELQDSPSQGYSESKKLIETWHNVDRLQYAVTPRFAPTSSPKQLLSCKQLLTEFPSVYLHTHVSENLEECHWVKQLFSSRDYVSVYDQFKLLNNRSILAHGIHLSDSELSTIAKRKSSIAHCPSSNLFLGSGLFNYKKTLAHQVKVSMGTDIGAGTSFSLLKMYQDSYKIQQLLNDNLSAYDGLYLLTLAGAEALDLDDKIGKLEIGYEADFIVLNPHATPYIKYRMSKTNDIHDKLFSLMMLSDDRTIYATYAFGNCVYKNY